MTCKLLSISLLPSDFLTEVNTIKFLAHINHNPADVDKIIRKKLISRSFDLSTTLARTLSSKKWVRLPFVGKFSFLLSYFPESRDLSPAFYSINISRNLFTHLKDVMPENEKSEVYSIQCSSCPAVYVEQTGCSLKSRISEHSKAISKNTHEKSTFAEHILSSGHSFDNSSSVSLLHFVWWAGTNDFVENSKCLSH